MKPYRRSNKVMMAKFRSASRLEKARLLVVQFAGDIHSLWRYGAGFPTFLKLIGSLILCLLILLPLLYPLFVIAFTYFTCESLFFSWWFDQPWRFHPMSIFRRVASLLRQNYNATDVWKVRDVLTRGILLTHSLATSVDYLCVMQGLLDET
ncbi:hypothetical protein KGM_215794 [Danaus plexippus plexippus]|uniref:Uncharacterized protein n=1 Tax=Danaus plexippus plexippus TaxID=278856 RepID=A0A212F1W7_DANPL|nr:hypothetical protein KGM_215794 [Danaus plexippus plexippus]